MHFFESEKIKKPEKKESVRSKAMSKKDIDILSEAMKDSRSFAKDALEITVRAALRVDEVAHLKAEHINLTQKTIYVSPEGAKNGRERTVPIRDSDLPYFRELLARNPDTGYLTQIEAKSIDKAIRRYMKSAVDEDGKSLAEKYPNETVHSICKRYATDRMQKERGSAPLADRKEEMRRWNKVSGELGHGEGRSNLYKAYCKG